MTPVERAAKAIMAIWETDRFVSADARVEARAALEAIAEPTPDMIDAGWKASKQCRLPADLAKVIWRAMHAAMMKEPE